MDKGILAIIINSIVLLMILIDMYRSRERSGKILFLIYSPGIVFVIDLLVLVLMLYKGYEIDILLYISIGLGLIPAGLMLYSIDIMEESDEFNEYEKRRVKEKRLFKGAIVVSLVLIIVDLLYHIAS